MHAHSVLEFIAKPGAAGRPAGSALQRALQLRKQELHAVSASKALERIVGESAAIIATRTQLQRFAGSHFPVLIEGESGAGKEVAAQALHELAGAERRFVALNCAAIAPGLIEATLFGHTRGAFTGAQNGPGRLFRGGGRRHPVPR